MKSCQLTCLQLSIGHLPSLPIQSFFRMSENHHNLYKSFKKSMTSFGINKVICLPLKSLHQLSLIGLSKSISIKLANSDSSSDTNIIFYFPVLPMPPERLEAAQSLCVIPYGTKMPCAIRSPALTSIFLPRLPSLVSFIKICPSFSARE